MTALVVVGFTCVMTLGGGLLALRLEAYRAFVLAFAAGALVAGALLDVIPDSLGLLEKAGAPFPHDHVMFACSLGFLAFYLFEQVSHEHHHHDDLAPRRAGQAGLWGAAGIGVHSLLDGVAIGEGFHAGAAVGWIVAFAVVAHKFADGVSTVGILMSTGRSTRIVNTMLGITTFAPLAGLGVQALVPLPVTAVALVLGWFSGVFLYLGAAALIPAAHAASRSRWVPVATLAGVAFVYFLNRASE